MHTLRSNLTKLAQLRVEVTAGKEWALSSSPGLPLDPTEDTTLFHMNACTMLLRRVNPKFTLAGRVNVLDSHLGRVATMCWAKPPRYPLKGGLN